MSRPSPLELREWLGLAPADGLVALAGLAVVGMRLIKNAYVDAFWAAAIVVLCVEACRVGMRPSAELSRLTNAAKSVFYPATLALGVLTIILNFALWNR